MCLSCNWATKCAKWYPALRNTTHRIVANLKPAKIRGVESNGMILCAADGTDVVFVTPQKEIGSGVEVR